jgi:hypothetical protein
MPDALRTSAARSEPIPIGGVFGLSYVDSYSEAWKALLPDARNFALPILYLQRHTFELLVKELLVGALKARSEFQILDDLFGTLSSAGPLNPDDFEKAHSSHSFRELLPCLGRNLAALARPPLPAQFDQAAKLFTAVDEDQPDRLRYQTMFSRKQRTTQRSFPLGLGGEPRKLAPCHEVGALLEQILLARSASLSALISHEEPPGTELSLFYTAALDCYQESERTVAYRIEEVATSTRDGTTEWTEADASSLDVTEHEILKRFGRELAPVCLESSFRERRLTIVILLGAGGKISWRDSGFFLAARRPNGTLTSGVWASETQSNLIYEIQEAFKRRFDVASP